MPITAGKENIMSAIKNYLMDLCYKTLEAAKEVDPYEFDFDSDEAFEETLNALTCRNVCSIVSFFENATEDISETEMHELYPTLTSVLPELRKLAARYIRTA